MKYLLSILIINISLSTNAQTIQFLKEYGEHFSEQKAYDVEVDQCGGVYTCGIFEGGQPQQVDSIPVTTYSGFGTGVLIKHDSNGDAIWARTFGSTCFSGRCAYYDITTDTLCNVYVCGDIACGDLILDTDTIPTIGGKLVVKYDSNGNRLWYKLFETVWANSRFGIDYSKSGYVYVGLDFHDTILVDGQIYSKNSPSGNNDICVIKLKEDGSVVWTKLYGDISDETCYSIASDDSGKFYICGSFQYSTIFDTDTVYNLGSWGTESAYLTACDSSGIVAHADWLGYGGHFYRVTKDGKNGWFVSAQQGDNAIHRRYDFTHWLSGYYGNSTQTGGIDPPSAFGACADPYGNFYVTGTYDDHFSLSGNGNSQYLPSGGNRYDAYVGFYDSNERITSLVRIPNPGFDDAGNAIAFLPPDKVLIAGTQGQVPGTDDYFLAIYSASQLLGINKSDDNNLLNIYPNPVIENNVTITVPDGINGELEIYSVTGIKLNVHKELHGNKINADVSSLTPGIYFLQYKCEEKNLTGTIIKM